MYFHLDTWSMSPTLLLNYCLSLNWHHCNYPLIESHPINHRILFIQLGFNKRKEHYLPSFLKNWLNDDCHATITQKDQLTFAFKETFPELYELHFAKTVYFDHEDIQIEGNTVIKYVKGYGGSGTYFVQSNDDLKNLKLDVNKKYLHCEYVSNLLLFKGKKFHVRINYLVSRIEDKCYYYLFKMGQIITARDLFDEEDFGNIKMHDTHFGTTDDNYIFPDDIDCTQLDVDVMYQQLIELFSAASSFVIPECREGDINAFEVFGCDILITNDYRIYLLEINTKTGIGIKYGDDVNLEKGMLYADNYWQSIIDCIIDPLIGKKFDDINVFPLIPAAH